MSTGPLDSIALTHELDPVAQMLDTIIASAPDTDRAEIMRAYTFAEERHRAQKRDSGEPFITHPMGVTIICAELGLDTAALQAALLHDTVEDTGTTLEEIEQVFGAEVALLVDGVTKLSKIRFESREERQAETYRKLVVAMARDVRVLIIKLCDRLHNMRTLSYMGRAKQVQKAQETLEIYAPLAHRLGIQSLRWEIEDLAFQALHPRRFREIQQMVAQRRADREAQVEEAGEILRAELVAAGIASAQIVGRAKHFYSIYDKMTRRGKEFNEIYDLTALRVLVDSVKDCYGVVGVVHSLWKPLPGRFKDYIATPKLNMYQSLHTTVISPLGTPLEIQIRTHEQHRTAEYGVAAHWRYKRPEPNPTGTNPGSPAWNAWVSQMMDWQLQTPDSSEFMDGLRGDLYQDEVYVFTPKGALKALAAGSKPIDFAYSVHTDVGHRCVGAKVNGRIVPLSYVLQNGDFVEILTSKAPRGPSRDWLNLVATGKARSKIRDFFRQERRADAEHQGRDALQGALTRAGLPSQKIVASPLLASIITNLGFKKADEFYVSLGLGKTQVQTVINTLLSDMKVGGTIEHESATPRELRQPNKRRPAKESADLGVKVDDVASDTVPVRLAECCKPVPDDPIRGYISAGRGVTVHREDCPNVKALLRNPERFTSVHWVGGSRTGFLVDIAVDGFDRSRLLEDLSKTFSEHGVNIVAANVQTEDGAIRNRFTVEVGDVESLRQLLAALRGIHQVFDAYRVTPGR